MGDRSLNERYKRVLEPIRLGPVAVANRFYMAPHGIPLELPGPGPSEHLVPSEEAAHYYAERVRGGVGLIFHSTQLGPVSRQSNLGANPWHPESIPHYANVADHVHEAGGKIMAEVWYACHVLKRWTMRGPLAPILAPSAGQHWLSPGVRRPASKADIARIVADYATATRNLRDAGYDGIEVHASHGAIIEHFLSPYFNRREDEYGGSLENRVRLLRETLEAVRGAAGPDMAVGIRINADELLPNGVDVEGTRAIIQHLIPTGLLDYVDLDVSVEPMQQHLMTTTFFEPKLHNTERVAAVRTAAGSVPVLATPGRLTQIQEAEDLLERGVADMIGAARGLIAEPNMLRNAVAGLEHRNRTCIAANHCTESGVSGGFGCAVNPAAGQEARWGTSSVTLALSRMRVVVVGAGVAGVEAACVAARRGHSVTVIERRDRIGGAVALWASIPGREHLGTLPQYYERELAELGVELRTGTAADADALVALSPDVVILATGASYAERGESAYEPLGVSGWDRGIVHMPEAVLEGRVALSGRVLVLDEEGYHTAAGVAEILAKEGAEVELITRKLSPFPGLSTNLQIGYVISRLRNAGVKISTSTWIADIGDGDVMLVDTVTGDSRRVRDVDAVVLATMRVADSSLAEQLESRVPYVYEVGDALAPRGLREAVYEGYRFGRAIGDDHMPKSVTEALFDPVGRPTLAGEKFATIGRA